MTPAAGVILFRIHIYYSDNRYNFNFKFYSFKVAAVFEKLNNMMPEFSALWPFDFT